MSVSSWTPQDIVGVGTKPGSSLARAHAKTGLPAVTVTVTDPDGAESLVGTDAFSITWTSSGSGIDHYKILLSTDGAASFPTVVVASDAASPYAWTIPNVTTTTARIQVQALTASNSLLALDDSDANFSIAAATLTVTAPNGTETLTGLDSTNITWTHTGTPDHYKILLSTNSGLTFPTVVTASTASSPYSWTINNITTTTARIRVQSLDAANVVIATDDSNADFSITAVP